MPTKKAPAYLLHKATGQARVRIEGRDIYLGTYGSIESRDRYNDIVTDWLRQANCSRMLLTIDELVLLYLDFAKGYYVKDHRPTFEIHSLRSLARLLVNEFGTTRARDFGPLKLKRLRELMIAEGWCRTTVNDQCRRLRRMFRWAVENEHVPPDVLAGLVAVSGLRRGKTPAPDLPPVQPVADQTVAATLPYLSPVVADMVRLQQLTGMRPAEVCLVRPADVDRSQSPWRYRPSSHKTQHRGRTRLVFMGPQAQAILTPYLDRPDSAFCFSPAESEEKRRAAAHAARKTPLKYGNRPGTNRKRAPKRQPRERFDKDSYGRAIIRGCEKAFGMPKELLRIPKKTKDNGAERKRVQTLAREWRSGHCWAPNQLRHAFATLIRKEHGLEAAQILLGHAAADVTQIYAERDERKAAQVASEIG